MQMDLEVTTNEVKAEMEVKQVVKEKGTNDYNKLQNIPTLNGKPIVGNMNEEDPTVPGWAKKDKKPEYHPEEIGAFGEDDVMSLEEIKEMMNSVFNLEGKR